MKTYIVTILFLLMCLNVEDSFSQDKVMDVGEELNYVVYYGFIKLGEVNMKKFIQVNHGCFLIRVYLLWTLR